MANEKMITKEEVKEILSEILKEQDKKFKLQDERIDKRIDERIDKRFDIQDEKSDQNFIVQNYEIDKKFEEFRGLIKEDITVLFKQQTGVVIEQLDHGFKLNLETSETKIEKRYGEHIETMKDQVGDKVSYKEFNLLESRVKKLELKKTKYA